MGNSRRPGASNDARKGAEMPPAQLFVALIGWALIAVAGYHVGKSKGRENAGLALTLLLGLIGLAILACLPKTEAIKQAEAQRRYQLQARAGFMYPPPRQYPYPPQQYPYAPAPDQAPPAPYQGPAPDQVPPPPAPWGPPAPTDPPPS
jgi:hypothetical protein